MALNELRVFETIARHRSLARAAEELGVQRPAVSKLLASLEARCGVRLVQRSTRRLALTSAGHALARRAREILALSSVALEEVRREATPNEGPLAYDRAAASTAHEELDAFLR